MNKAEQESPAIADKPARRESLPKLLQFGVPTTLSLTMEIVTHCQEFFGCDLPSVTLRKRCVKFIGTNG